MFNKLNLKQKMILFTIFSLIVIFIFSKFMNNSIDIIQKSIDTYSTKAVKGKMLVLSIEKDLNYISRCSRDIMLGNSYLENMKKIENRIVLIENNFKLLEKTIIYKKNQDTKLLVIEHAKNSTLQFIYGVKLKMGLLKNSNIKQKVQAYKDYKKDLTPLAIKSRIYFLKIRQIKDKGFITISNSLKENILNERYFIVIATLILSLIAILIMTLIYFIMKKQFSTQEDLNSINTLLSQYVIYSKTDLKGIITEVSDAFCEISMYSREELIGQPHSIIRHTDMSDETFKDLWTTIKQGKVWEGDVQNLKKDGNVYWVKSRISSEYDEDDNIKGYVAIRYDITSKKNYEQQNEQLMQSEKMASLGEMIGNIAHQWRQPLSAISSTASSIKVQNDFGILDDNDISIQMEAIVEKTHYLSDTINTFRDFIKGEKKYKELLIQDEINQAINISSATLNTNNIFIHSNIDDVDDINITMVSGELPQVIINIINNAKDILVENKIKNPSIDLNLSKNSRNAIITIEDNAGGIPADIMPKIFEPYFTTKHQSQGTGLGLHMSYQIITESLKGHLFATNTIKGAKFTIELPLS